MTPEQVLLSLSSINSGTPEEHILSIILGDITTFSIEKFRIKVNPTTLKAKVEVPNLKVNLDEH